MKNMGLSLYIFRMCFNTKKLLELILAFNFLLFAWFLGKLTIPPSLFVSLFTTSKQIVLPIIKQDYTKVHHFFIQEEKNEVK